MTTVAFFGSHPLGERCLERLTDHPDVEVPLVVTYARDADTWWDGSVHERALEMGHDVATIEQERRVLDLSVYYPNIIGPNLLDHPQVASINLHQAELPRYRGSNVFSHAIMNARDDDHWQYGTTMHVMAEEVDAGDIVDREFVPITELDTARTLYERVTEASVTLFERQLPRIVDRSIPDGARPQADFDGERYFYTKESLDGEKRISREQLLADDEATQRAVYDKIRALDFPPFEPAYIELDDQRIRLTRTSYEDMFAEAPVPPLAD
jgi:methionyl-tRNA formyltransferase